MEGGWNRSAEKEIGGEGGNRKGRTGAHKNGASTW